MERERNRWGNRAAAAALAAAALLVPAASPAAIESGCGGQHSRETACKFVPAGVAFSIYGTATNNAYLSVAIEDNLGNPVAYCQGYGFCRASFLGGTSVAQLPAGQGPFSCRVRALGPGEYDCRTYPV